MNHLSADELETLRDTSPMEFHARLETWAAGDHFVTKDNADELGQRMIDDVAG